MVQKKVKAIEWTENAVGNFNEILEHLAEHSPSAVDIVGNALLDIIESLDTEYDHFPPDRFKKNNDSSYRAAAIFTYRISYLVASETIFILRIRHTSREPLGY